VMTLADRVVVFDTNDCLFEQNKEKLVRLSIRSIEVGSAIINTQDKKVGIQWKRDIKEVPKAFD
ncbi:MAG: hypothetical protein Q9191_008070, partial [Dirinaria sp. TL-2023a]